MRSAAPGLLPIFRSTRQAKILTHLFLHPHEETTLSQLARDLESTPGAMHAEVIRLLDAGLIADRRVGQARLLRANTEARVAHALTELLTITFGPQVVIAEEFADLPGTDLVAVYGSWARRYRGELGREPADVDVMVIGSPDRDQVYEAADRAERRLGLTVNPTVRSTEAWETASDALVITAKPDAVTVIDHRAEEAS